MILLSFFNTTEFYVIMTIVAASVVAMAARPRSRGAVREYLLSSVLNDHSEAFDSDTPQIELRCNTDGTVTLIRRGLEDISLDGAVSLAVKVNGTDIDMQERLTPGRGHNATYRRGSEAAAAILPSETQAMAAEAVFHIDFLAPGRYHLRYNSDATGRFVAFSLHVTPGLVARRLLNN